MKKNLALVLIVFLIFQVPRVIRVNVISCNTQYGPCASYLTEKLDDLPGDSLFESKRKVVNILKSELFIKDYGIQYKIPDRLAINIIEKKPSFSLLGEDDGLFASVDSEGYILRLEETTNLPYIKVKEKVGNVGDKVSEKNLFALKLIEKVFTSYSVKSGVSRDDSLVVEFPDKLTVIFPLTGEPDLLISSFELIIRRLKQEEEVTKIDTIDMRFRNPVLR